MISTLKTHFNYNLQPADKGCSLRSNHGAGLCWRKSSLSWRLPGWLPPKAEPTPVSGTLCSGTQLGHLRPAAAVTAAMCLEFISCQASRNGSCFLSEAPYPFLCPIPHWVCANPFALCPAHWDPQVQATPWMLSRGWTEDGGEYSECWELPWSVKTGSNLCPVSYQQDHSTRNLPHRWVPGTWESRGVSQAPSGEIRAASLPDPKGGMPAFLQWWVPAVLGVGGYSGCPSLPSTS